jgi:hypothetical protein
LQWQENLWQAENEKETTAALTAEKRSNRSGVLRSHSSGETTEHRGSGGRAGVEVGIT